MSKRNKNCPHNKKYTKTFVIDKFQVYVGQGVQKKD